MRRCVVGLVVAFVVACGSSNDSDDDGGGAGGSGGILNDGSCRTRDDCRKPDESCFPPGAANCGACDDGPNPCDTDQECVDMLGPDNLCGPPIASGACTCGFHTGNCVEACMGPSDCAPNEDCNAGLCEARACSVDGDCGEASLKCTPAGACVVPACGDDGDCDPNFECTEAFACARAACGNDADCDGFCVLGGCHAGVGRCEPPAP